MRRFHFLGAILYSDLMRYPKDDVLDYHKVHFKYADGNDYRIYLLKGSESPFGFVDMCGFKYCVEMIEKNDYIRLKWLGEEGWFDKFPDKDKQLYMFNLDYFSSLNLLKSSIDNYPEDE